MAQCNGAAREGRFSPDLKSSNRNLGETAAAAWNLSLTDSSEVRPEVQSAWSLPVKLSSRTEASDSVALATYMNPTDQATKQFS